MLKIRLSVSTNHHKWLSTGVFLCTPIDNCFFTLPYYHGECEKSRKNVWKFKGTRDKMYLL